jgi:hypothetical protein
METSETDRLLAEWVRAGMQPAEMAVRLGLPVADVRERVRRLGVVDDPVSASGTHGRRRTRLPAIMASLVVAVATVVAIGWFVRDGSGASKAPATVAAAVGNSNTAATPTAGTAVHPTATPTALAVRRVGEFATPMYDLGVFLRTVSNSTTRDAVFYSAMREGDELYQYSPAVAWESSGGGPHAMTWIAKVAETQITLNIEVTEGGFTWFRGTEQPTRDAYALSGTSSGQAALLLEAFETQTGHPRAVTVDLDGHLLIGMTALRQDNPGQRSVGTAIDFSAAEATALTDAVDYANTCQEGLCTATVAIAGPLRAPVGGTVSCVGGAVLIDTPSFRLAIRQVGSRNSEPCELTQFEAAAGDKILYGTPNGGYYSFTGLTEPGSLIPTAVSEDGTLFIGKIVPTEGCPCVIRN